ncbi:DUF2185 domain-containing protein [Dysgonomonas sp. 520]|uniref:DUF2185 domain-containing protein n=1 Tax=Dysgonomonas sp. 520 TaxID=2302931 RepID=UPI0013D842F7|nr:DUF2185 domain-containing protein [Dysgonomonas sp. 520]NDW08419.1 DUF2185 domain-containing protein [Dysgonomonas sp. 520]
MTLFNRKKKKQTDFDDFPPIGGLMVSKMITDEGCKPMFMYRDKRSRPEDSGWRIFSGYESDEYTNNPENAGIYSASTILRIDPSIADLLLKGVGSVYERKSEKSEWYKVHNFKLGDDYMVKHQLTDKWTLEINNLFERRLEEDGSLLYTTGDKSLRLVVWNDKGKKRDDIYEDHKMIVENRDQSRSKTLETYDFTDDAVARVGYLIKESDGQKEYGVIYAFSVIDENILQIAIYFDEEADKDWAISTWKNIKTE